MKRLTVLALVALGSAGLAGDRKGEWAKGVSYTTSWSDAIKECRNTGKLLFVYNGWERSGI